MINELDFSSSIKKLFVLFGILFCIANNLFAQAVIHHSPLGYENLYPDREVDIPLTDCEREPRDPVENENVLIHFTTSPIYNKQECFVDVSVNGQQVKTYRAPFMYNYAGESCWKADIGSYVKNDSVSYNIRINYCDTASAKSSEYYFITYGWDYLTDVSSTEFKNNKLMMHCRSTNAAINPIVQISFDTETSAKLSIILGENQKEDSTIPGDCTLQQFEDKAELSSSKISFDIQYSPFRLKLISKENKTEAVSQYSYPGHSSIGFLNNKYGILKVNENFYTANDEKFFGFGERYNAINQRGNSIDNYVVAIWREQGLRSYIPVPFYFTNKNYGFFLNSTYYSRFNLDTDKTNRCEIVANFGRKFSGDFEYYLFANEKPSEIISSYASVTGKQEPIPVWTLGPWISANEWDKQSEIEAQVDSLKKYDIPNTVVVIEAWSDEETFYIFNDAVYQPKPGSGRLTLKDLKFTGRWYDPVGMINNLHKDNMKLVLWNIPVLKSSSVKNEQRDIDEKYAIEKNYVVKNPDGSPYRIPPAWFSNSLNLDFTNKEASDWWMNKRRYLIEEMKVDGFKPDGGEFIWGRDLVFSNGKNGEEMRNIYANFYLDAYYQYLKSINKDAIVFHRAGTFGSQKHPLAWNGDQTSSFPAFMDAIRSCLNLSMSGISFVAYDIAGYYDETNLSPALYKRSVAQAAFSPAMQLHSGNSGDAGLERTPWNIAKMYNDPSCIDIYKKFANARFNLMPYLYSEMAFTSKTAVPFMHPLLVDYPDDEKIIKSETDYMLGRNLLVSPITEPGTKKEVYLPEGQWFDFWSFKKYEGKKSYELDVDYDYLPVFIKCGSITPLNLNDNYGLASGMTNDLSSYKNLTFVVMPENKIEYEFHDYVNDEVRKIAAEQKDDKIFLEIPSFKSNVSLIINSPVVKEIIAGGKRLSPSRDMDEFIKSAGNCFYANENNMLYVKLKPSKVKREMVIKTK